MTKTCFELINVRIYMSVFYFFMKPLFALHFKLHLTAATSESGGGKKCPFTSATKRAQKHTFYMSFKLIFMLQHAYTRNA